MLLSSAERLELVRQALPNALIDAAGDLSVVRLEDVESEMQLG